MLVLEIAGGIVLGVLMLIFLAVVAEKVQEEREEASWRRSGLCQRPD